MESCQLEQFHQFEKFGQAGWRPHKEGIASRRSQASPLTCCGTQISANTSTCTYSSAAVRARLRLLWLLYRVTTNCKHLDNSAEDNQGNSGSAPRRNGDFWDSSHSRIRRSRV